MKTKDEFRHQFAEVHTPAARREVWCQALESGLWKQTAGTLRDVNRFCCLGVACDLISPTRWNNGYWEHEMDVLPSSARLLLGLSEAAGNFDGADLSLTEVNDGGRDFQYIAKLIRSEPTGFLL